MKKIIFIGLVLAFSNGIRAQNVRTTEVLRGTVYFSPDGKNMLTTSGQLYDLRTGRTAADLNYKGSDQNGEPTYFEAAFSPSGNLIAYNRKIYDGNTVQALYSLPEREAFSRHYSNTEKQFYNLKDLDVCAFSDDDKTVLAADEIFELGSQKLITTLKLSTYKAGLPYLFFAHNTHLSIRREIAVNADFTDFESNYNDAVSPDVKYHIAGESADDATIGFFRVQPFEANEQYDAKQDLLHLHYNYSAEFITKVKLSDRFEEDKTSFSIAGNLVAIIDKNLLKIFDLTTGKLKSKIENKFENEWEHTALSASGKLVYADDEDNNSAVYSAETGKLIRILKGGENDINSYDDNTGFLNPVFSPDDNYLINGFDGLVIDLKAGKSLTKVPFYDEKIIVLSATLTPNNRAVFQYSDGSARVFDALSGNELFSEQISNIGTLFFGASANGKFAAASDWKGNLTLWKDENATPFKVWQANQGSPISQIVFDAENNQMHTYGFDNKLNTWDLATLSLLHSVTLEEPVNQIYALGDYLLANTLTQLFQINYQTGTAELITEFPLSYVKPVFIFQPKMHLAMLGSNLFDYKLHYYLYNFEIERKKDTSWDKVMALGAVKSEPHMVYSITSQDQIMRWDLGLGKVSLLNFKSNSPKEWFSSYGFDRVHSQPVISQIVSQGNSKFYDLELKIYTNPFYQSLKTYGINPSTLSNDYQISRNARLVSASILMKDNNRAINIHDATTGAIISTINYGETGSIMRAFFSPTADTVYFTAYIKSKNVLANAQTKTGSVLNKVEDFPFEAKDILVAPNGKWIAVTDGWNKILVYNNSLTTKLMELKLPFESVNSYLVASPDSKNFILCEQEGFKGGEAAVINIETNTIRQIPGLHYHACFSADNKYIISTLKESKADADFLTIFKVSNLEKISTHMQMGISDKSMIYTPDQFYMANKEAINEVHFSSGKKTFLFDQFDLRFNRPDIVLQRIGYANHELVIAYKKAWEKRVRRMGFDPKLFDGFDTKLNTPELTLLNEVPLNTENETISLNFNAFDKLFPIERLHIYANGCPIFGSKGKLVKPLVKKSTNGFELPVLEEVKLLSGRNTIEVSVANSQGIESLRERFEVIYSASSAEKPSLYIVSIGVSKFVTSEMNLTYAAKDAEDFVNLYQEKQDNYKQIKIMKFTNDQAVLENILKVKAELMNSKINDEVLVFVASHGLLDNQMDYYIAMHDMDFNNPALKGLKYEVLEGLLDGIPAREKLMFIDACHSGEVDKEESELVATNVQNASGVSSRGFKSVQNKQGIGLQTSFELMKELFADLRRGSGTIVISSASGKEFAFESDQWNNGVFTYSLIEGLKSGNADLDKNSEIIVSEVRDYVAKKVFDLTSGKQNPTTRTEKLENDFKVW